MEVFYDRGSLYSLWGSSHEEPICHPNSDFNKNQIAYIKIISCPRYTKASFFQTRTRLALRRFWAKESGHPEITLLKCATPIVERVVQW